MAWRFGPKAAAWIDDRIRRAEKTPTRNVGVFYYRHVAKRKSEHCSVIIEERAEIARKTKDQLHEESDAGNDAALRKNLGLDATKNVVLQLLDLVS